MDKSSFTAVFCWKKKNQEIDLDIPYDISANELIIALNEALRLGMDTSDPSRCHLKAENPIALLRGNKLLKDFRLREGTIINYTL
jgi:YukD.